jgi:hypothetical protein
MIVKGPKTGTYELAWCEDAKAYEFTPEGGIISDGFGNSWAAKCHCGGDMEIVRPGKVQCSKCG